MSNPQFYVYRIWGEQGNMLNISHKPDLDLDCYAKFYGFNRLEILSPKMPIAKALETLNSVAGSKLGQSYPSAVWPNESPYAFKVGSCLTAENLTLNEGKSILPGRFPGPGDYEISWVYQFLAGRILLWEEIKAKVNYECQRAAEARLDSVLSPVSRIFRRWPLLDIMQVLYLLGFARLLPGISYNINDKYICNRCGQSKSIVRVGCPDCGEECYQCVHGDIPNMYSPVGISGRLRTVG